MCCAVQAGSDSEDEAPEDAVRMSFLGKKPGKAPQRSVLAGLHEDHVVSSTCCRSDGNFLHDCGLSRALLL